MSEVKVNKITPRTNCGTTTLGDSGDTINIPAGVTISNNGTATGFGATGAVNWDVASIKTVDFTATAGVGYFVDTATTGAVDVTLPASPTAGDVVGVADYANNFGTVNCTLLRNGSNIGGMTLDATMTTSGVAVTLVYVDATKGWIVTDSGNQSDAPTATYVAATGGCITTCGNFKVHTFLAPGTFTVTCSGNPIGSSSVDYMIVGGGGGGQSRNAKNPCYAQRYANGAGGAGGWRASSGAASGCYSAGPAPLVGLVSAYTVAGTPASPGAYAVVVGGGGPSPTIPSTDAAATPGVASSVFCKTSAGGGGGAYGAVPGFHGNADNGGSGGGAGGVPCSTIGSGNTPPTTPPQGNPGGTGTSAASTAGGGGGGAGGNGQAGAGNPGPPDATGGAGGAGVASNISFSSVSYAGGGGGGAGYPGGSGTITGGTATAGGGAGGQVSPTNGTAGTVNTGGGGGGSGGTGSCGTCRGGNGGSGIIIIRYKYQ
jgi:hypothetical protein